VCEHQCSAERPFPTVHTGTDSQVPTAQFSLLCYMGWANGAIGTGYLDVIGSGNVAIWMSFLVFRGKIMVGNLRLHESKCLRSSLWGGSVNKGNTEQAHTSYLTPDAIHNTFSHNSWCGASAPREMSVYSSLPMASHLIQDVQRIHKQLRPEHLHSLHLRMKSSVTPCGCVFP
jgi:hypothetical protein